MKIKMRTTMAGPRGAASAGSIVDIPQGEAYGLIEGGYAEQVDDGPARVESAVAGAPETADAPANRRRDPLDHDGDGRKGGSKRKVA